MAEGHPYRPAASSGRGDDGIDVVLPSDGEMLLERGDRVEVGGRAERVVEYFHSADPVDPVGPAGVRGAGPAQQVPPAMANDHGPRVDLDEPLRPGLGAVVDPRTPAVGAGLHEG